MKQKSLIQQYAEARELAAEPSKLIHKVADAAHCDYQTARLWLTGINKPGKQSLILLEKEFETPWQVLFPELADEEETSNS